MKHLLIVDDDKTNLANARNALSDSYKVTAVLSGEQALRFLASNTPDLILLDINMPEMNGFELMEKIRGIPALQFIPIIFLTADGEPETESRCLEAGAVDFITKPFVQLVMKSRIGRTLELEELRKNLECELDEKIQEVSDMKNLSSHDPLTGLWNRKYTEEAVNGVLASEKKGAVLMIDMDNFKSVNDIYGHQTGDDTLRLFARTMQDYSSENDILCRIGGDEFVMFISDDVSKKYLKTTARALIDTLTERIKEAGINTETSVSIGISLYPEDGADFNSLYNSADKALYFVKQNGKRSFHFFSEQKAEEERRSENLVDISYIRDYLVRSDANRGSYILNLESFSHVYNFIRRIVERNSSSVQTILFTVSMLDPEGHDYEPALAALENAIFSSLRRVDVSARYSGRQILVVLMGTDRENCVLTAGRIVGTFREMYSGPEINLTFDIEKLEGKSDLTGNDKIQN